MESTMNIMKHDGKAMIITPNSSENGSDERNFGEHVKEVYLV